MCLESINNPKGVVHKRLCKLKYGYKVFIQEGQINCNLYPLYCGRNVQLPIGEWINRKEVNRVNNTIQVKHNDRVVGEYKAGFHVFVDVQDAKDYAMASNEVVRKVMFKNVVASGLNSLEMNRCCTVVAGYIKILEEGVK